MSVNSDFLIINYSLKILQCNLIKIILAKFKICVIINLIEIFKHYDKEK